MLTSLSAVSKSYIVISKDNRLHLWDTDTRKEKRSYVEKNHLAHSYTCLDWLQINHDNLGLCAVGCSDGAVIIWDFVRGIVSTTISHCNSSISSISFSLDGKYIFIGDDTNYVSQYKLSDNEFVRSIKTGKYGVFKLAMNPRVDVLAIASTSIRLFDVSSGEKRKLDAKFPGGVSGLQYSQCGCFLVACVRESREVFLFDIRATAVSTQPLCIISVLGTPSNVAVRSFDSHIDILCWFECTDGCMIRYNLARGTAASTNIEPDTEKKTKKKKKSLSKLDNEDSDKEHTNGEANMGDRSSLFAAYSMTKIQSHGEISCASFGRPGNPSADGITIITDSHSTPCFQYAEHSSNATPDEILTNIVLPIPSSSSDLNNLKLNKSGASDNNSNNNSSIANSSVMMLGPFESGGKQLPHLGEDGENLVLTTDKKQRRTSFDESTLVTSVSRSATKKRSNSEVSMDSVSSSTSLDELKGKRNKQGIELTIEQRLEQLSSKANEIDQLQRVEQTNSNTTTTVTSSSSASGLPSSDSLVVLIEQALQASDDTLLEQCLSCQESSVIETTTRLLPTSKAINFLMKIIAKFEKRPSRVMLLLPWLNHLLQQHATFLSGFPNFAKTFASLSQILEQRVSCLNSFTALNGRLDLIMHQSLSSLSPSSSSLTGSSQQQSHLRNNGLSDGPAKQGGLGTNSPMAVHNEDDEE